MALSVGFGSKVMFVACSVCTAVEVTCVLSTLVLLRRTLNSTFLVVPKQSMMIIHLWQVREMFKQGLFQEASKFRKRDIPWERYCFKRALEGLPLTEQNDLGEAVC